MAFVAPGRPALMRSFNLRQVGATLSGAGGLSSLPRTSHVTSRTAIPCLAPRPILSSARSLVGLPSVILHQCQACEASSKPRPRGLNRGLAARCMVSTAETTSLEEEAQGKSDRPNLLEVLRDRGLVDAVTSEELKEASKSPLKVYVGFDPTAESLHLGNLLGIIALAWAIRCGHTAVALLGGATARVGDPSGKSAERPVLDEQTILKNTKGIEATLEGILRRQERAESSLGGRVEILNNYDWWREVSLLEFLRDVGKFARVGTMMAKESVKKRLNSEEGMSFTEFTYQLLQGYDFVHLYKERGVNVQMGGSDQWGNITAGTDLIRRLDAVNQQEAGGQNGATSTAADEPDSRRVQAFGLTWPLLLKSDGSKFGKSEGGAIWLSPSYLSPYKFYQYMFSTPDADVVRFLQMLTFLDSSTIKEIENDMKSPTYVVNSAQRKLAEEVTRFVHGEEGLQEALKATEALAPGAATKLDAASLDAISEDVPSVSLPSSSILSVPIVDVAAASGLAASKGAAKRLVKQGGLYLNNNKVTKEDQVIEPEDLLDGRMLLLAAGKKNKMIVRVQQ